MATVSADLRFSVEIPGYPALCGSLTGSGQRFELRLSDPAFFAGRRDARQLRDLADGLAARGVSIVVMAGDTALLEVGATSAPWWQRPVTRSRHLRVLGMRGALTGASGRVRGGTRASVLPGAEWLPPVALLPLGATFGSGRRPVTTTHDPRRGGNPRLALAASAGRFPDDGRTVFPLRGERTTIGSGPECDIQLADLDPLHAVIVHDERDELVLVDRSHDRSSRVNGRHFPEGRALRTGARVEIGPWVLAYRRAEYADHGRAFGGRVGGEIGHQQPQSERRAVSR